MTPDSRILAATRAEFENRRRLADDGRARYQRELYARAPELAALDTELRALGVEIGRSVFASDGKKRLAEIKNRSAALRAERSRRVAEVGMKELPTVRCEACGDAGIRPDGRICTCFREEYARQTLAYLDGRLPAGTGDFRRFDPRLFSAEPDARLEISPRMAAESAEKNCRAFAEHFDETHENLLLIGAPSCGKTYLAAAIARRAAERGFSVDYGCAFDVCNGMDAQHFGRGGEENDAAVQNWFDCDLLVIDDLGCEMGNAFTAPALNHLLSRRADQRKSTVILTELSEQRMAERYLPQTVVRLRKEYTVLPLIGTIQR